MAGTQYQCTGGESYTILLYFQPQVYKNCSKKHFCNLLCRMIACILFAQSTWHWRNVKSAAKRPLPKVNPGSLALWPTNLQDGKCNWNSNGSNCSIRFGMPGPIPASQRFHALDAAIDTQQSQNPQGLCDPQATRLWDGHGDLSSKVGLQMPWSQITGVMWWWFHRGLWRRISSMCCGLRL